MTRLKTSRPTLSVPIGCCQLGAACRLRKSTNAPALSGDGANMGAKMAASATLSTMNAPINASGLLRNR